MPETIKDLGDGPKWHIEDIRLDLRLQGGLSDVQLFSDHTDPFLFCGTFEGSAFLFFWEKDLFLWLHLQKMSQPLIDAFTKVLGYSPGCRYERWGLVVIEWNKNFPGENYFRKIKRRRTTQNFIRL